MRESPSIDRSRVSIDRLCGWVAPPPPPPLRVCAPVHLCIYLPALPLPRNTNQLSTQQTPTAPAVGGVRAAPRPPAPALRAGQLARAGAGPAGAVSLSPFGVCMQCMHVCMCHAPRPPGGHCRRLAPTDPPNHPHIPPPPYLYISRYLLAYLNLPWEERFYDLGRAPEFGTQAWSGEPTTAEEKQRRVGGWVGWEWWFCV